MGLDRLLADPQLPGDEFVGKPAGDQLQNFAFAVAQLMARSTAPGTNQRSGRSWRERRFALGGGADAADQLVGLGILEEVADGAGVECGEDLVLFGKGREDDDLWRGIILQHSASRLGSIDSRHPQVHQDHVGQMFTGEANRLVTVGGGGDHVDVRDASQQPAEPLAHEAVIVSKQYANHVRGISRRTVVPPPGAESRSSLPRCRGQGLRASADRSAYFGLRAGWSSRVRRLRPRAPQPLRWLATARRPSWPRHGAERS